jgi:hypothetical protein
MTETIEIPPRSFEGTSTRGVAPSTSGEATGAKTEQFIITRNVETGDVLSIETIDASGARATIPDGTAQKIAGQDEFKELESALNEAFDSGVTMLFEDSEDDDGAYEYNRGALLRVLAIALAGPGSARRLANTRQNLLRKLILRRLGRRYFLRRRLAAS